MISTGVVRFLVSRIPLSLNNKAYSGRVMWPFVVFILYYPEAVNIRDKGETTLIKGKREIRESGNEMCATTELCLRVTPPSALTTVVGLQSQHVGTILALVFLEGPPSCSVYSD